MKLRIRGNSIRLRLGRSEVARLVADGAVSETTIFDADARQCLEYRLVATPAVSAVTASFEGSRVTVRVPSGLATAWGSTDQISIEAVQPTSNGAKLRILIEKDLECLDAPVDESQEDAFARDDEGKACSATDPASTLLRPNDMGRPR